MKLEYLYQYIPSDKDQYIFKTNINSLNMMQKIGYV